MKIIFSEKEEAFRTEIKTWMQQQMAGGLFEHLREKHFSEGIEDRIKWEKHLAAEKLNVMAWPKQYGGREASLAEQVIWTEEYERAKMPGRVNYIGTELLAPTMMLWGREDQKQRFLPAIAEGREMWAQGFSEPSAGSDLSSARTKAILEERPDGKKVWVVDGQKIWTSLAHVADWIFVLCRTESGSQGAKGLSYLLVPMKQKGIKVRPIRQITNDADFNEVFLDRAETAEENVLGPLGEGWKVANSTLMFERGVSTFALQTRYKAEFRKVVEIARKNGKFDDDSVRHRLAEAYAGLRVMEHNTLRVLTNAEHGVSGGEMLINKLYFTSWHQKFLELAMDILGPAADYSEDPEQEYHPYMHKYLFARSDTIYGGTTQIQRNIISERALGLPREPKAAKDMPNKT